MQVLLVALLFHTTHKKILLHEEKTFKDISDKIISNILRSTMFTYGEKIDHHFHQQVAITNDIYFCLDESSTNICQFYFSTNYFLSLMLIF